MALKYPNPRPGSVTNATVAVGAAITGDKIVSDFGPQTIVGNRLNLGVGSGTTGVWAGVNNDKTLIALLATNRVSIGGSTAGLDILTDVLIGAGADFKITRGFSVFNATVVSAKPTVTGSRGGNAALASFLTVMATYGWFTDSTTA